MKTETGEASLRPTPPEPEAAGRLRVLSTFKEALENATDAIGMSTPQGAHYYQNRAFTELFGDIGSDPASSIYCDEAVGREVFATIKAGGSWTGEVAMYARDRRVVSILLRAYASKDEHGNITALVGIHTDITERKRAAQSIGESEERLRALSDNLPGGLVYQVDTGRDGTERRLTYISDGVQELHEVTAEAVLEDARVIYSQMNEEDRRLVAEREAQATKTLTPFSAEVRVTLPSGKMCWRLFASAPRRMPDGRVIWDGVELDITDRKVVEQRARLAARRTQMKVGDPDRPDRGGYVRIGDRDQPRAHIHGASWWNNHMTGSLRMNDSAVTEVELKLQLDASAAKAVHD